jgi:NodT family efflux transporter outer membrane factor (OMF) lipoprotein
MSAASELRPKRALVRLALVCAALTLNACTTLGPDYQEPTVDWLDDWQPALYGQIGTLQQQVAADLRFWWRLFDDPVLNRLIELARQENPSLRIAGLRILESRAQLGIAVSGRYPQVQQLTGALSYVNNRQRGGVVPSNTQDFLSVQAGFNLAWELDFWGRFKRGIESADAAFFASIANQQDVQVLLSAQVADLYFAYRTTELRIAIARENAALQKRSYEITERLYQSGAESELDLQQAKTQYLATLSTIPNLQITLTKTRNALGTLLGRPPGARPALAGSSDRLPSVKPVVIRDIPARLLMRRPDIRAAAWQAAAQSAQIGIAEADFYPSIALLGSIGWSGTTLNASSNIGTLAVGPSLSWNIFNYGRIANNVRVQDARLQQLIEQYQETVLQAAQEIDDAAISVVKTAHQQAILKESVVAAKRALELAHTRYREGYAGFQRVLDAQRALFSQAERQLVNQGSHISAVIALYKSLGGGWFDAPVEQLIPDDVRTMMQDRSDWGDLLKTPLPAGSSKPTSAPETGSHE